MQIPLSSNITISPEVLAQEVGSETVLLDLQSEIYFGQDEVGTRIWQLLQQHNDLQKIFDTMQVEYDIDAIQLKIDINELLERLFEEELIAVEPAPT